MIRALSKAGSTTHCGYHSNLFWGKLEYLYILSILDYPNMPTLLVKGLSEDTLKQLKRLKVEFDCDTWAELFDRLVAPNHRELAFTKNEIADMKQGVREFISLADRVSGRWRGQPGVLEESRKSKRHE